MAGTHMITIKSINENAQITNLVLNLKIEKWRLENGEHLCNENGNGGSKMTGTIF